MPSDVMGNMERTSTAAATTKLGILTPEKRGGTFVIESAKLSDVPQIVKMVNNEAKLSGAVIKVTPSEVTGWVESNLSFVAKMGTEIVGHTAGYVWPGSGLAEHRAVVVLPEYRGNGINASLTAVFMQTLIESNPSITIISLKNANAHESAKSGIIKSGFRPISVDELPDEIFNSTGKREDYTAYAYNYEEVKELERS